MAFAAHPAKITKRVLPRQRAIFVAADRVEDKMARRIRAEIRDLQADVNLSEVAKLVQVADEEGEVYRALNAKGTEGIATAVSEELATGMEAGGKIAAKELGRVVVLDMTRPHLNKWLENHTGELITNIGKTSREAVKVTLRDGILRGRHPTRLARDLRDNLGLTAPQAKAVARRRASLLADGVSQGRVDQIVGQYTDKLIKQRARVIAHHESMDAVNRGRFELWKQLVDEGALPENVQRIWDTAADDAVCDICAPMDQQKRGLGEAFEGGDGSVIGGAPAHVGCRCTERIAD